MTRQEMAEQNIRERYQQRYKIPEWAIPEVARLLCITPASQLPKEFGEDTGKVVDFVCKRQN
ncbi:MAG TPA: hypothetical protein VLH19_04575 [Patescibacteria group bacterium]|nr:hypothetical protein [Patescibacteria group bacterium]